MPGNYPGSAAYGSRDKLITLRQTESARYFCVILCVKRRHFLRQKQPPEVIETGLDNGTRQLT
jgi:hypothetical protein